MPRTLVYKGKLIERRYDHSIPLCAVPTCKNGAEYFVSDHESYTTDYRKFCRDHEKQRDETGEDP